MKGKIALIVLLVFVSMHVGGQSIPFQLGYNGGAEDQFRGVAECADGGFIAVGSTKSFGAGNNDVLLVRTDRNGNVRWSKTIGTSGSDIGAAVVCTADNGFMIAGNTNYQAQANMDALIIRTDSNGVVIWGRTYGVDTLPDAASCIIRTSDGNFVVGGSTYGQETNSVSMHALSIKIDSLGNPIWIRKTANGNSEQQWYQMKELPGGNIVEAGTIGGFFNDAIIEVISPAGVSLRHKRYGTTSGLNYIYGMAVGEDGQLLAAGATTAFGAGGFDILLISVDTSLSSAVIRSAGTPATEVGYAVVASPDSGFMVAGMTNAHASNGFYDPFIMRVSPSGAALWTKVYGTAFGDINAAALITQDDHYLCAGYSYGLSSGNDMAAFLMKTDTAGEVTCAMDTMTFSQMISGSVATFIPYDSAGTEPFSPIALVSVPITGLQLNPLCLNGVAEQHASALMNVFPDPSDGYFTLEINAVKTGKMELIITDVNGRTAQSFRSIAPGLNSIDASQLTSGIYFLTVISENEILQRTKLVITH